MNSLMIRRLIWKDWYFNKKLIALYLFAGAMALAMVGLGDKGIFYAGNVMFVTAMIGVSIHLVFATVVNDRNHQTLAFVMSLPITIMDYTLAKVAINVVIFLITWISLAISTYAVILARLELPNGLIPVVTILLLEIFTAHLLLLGAALISESEAWTVGTMVCCNLFFNVFMYLIASNPQIGEAMGGAEPHWTPLIFKIIGAEILLLILIPIATFVIQARKKDFI